MSVKQRDIALLIRGLSEKTSLLDMLFEYEETMDNAGVFAYKNWEMGELVEGPHINRYWFTATWMYPRALMPDLGGAQRLLKYGCSVKYEKSIFEIPKRVLDPRRDIEHSAEQNKKPRTTEMPVWLVTITMPRRYVDQSQEGVFEISGQEIDMETVEDAWAQELDKIEKQDEKDNNENNDEEQQ